MLGKAFNSTFDYDWRSKFHSVYVGNLHLLSSRGALWKIFRNFGIVTDIFISLSRRKHLPAKSKYAFVRYKTKIEAATAVEKGKDVMLDNHRLVVNFAVSSSKDKVLSLNASKSARTMSVDDREDRETSSEKERVIKSSRNNILSLPSISVDWLQRSAMGSLRVPSSSKSTFSEISEGLKSRGVQVSLAPISNVNVLLSFANIEDMKLHLEQFRELFNIWFQSLIPWSGQLVERIHHVWVKLDDIPLALWHKDFFFSLGNDWGKVLELAEVTASRSNLIAAWILVEVTNCKNIPESIQGMANGLSFKLPVTIVSENSVPKPYCGWSEFGSNSSSDSSDFFSDDNLQQVEEPLDVELGHIGEAKADIEIDAEGCDTDNGALPFSIDPLVREDFSNVLGRDDRIGDLDLVPHVSCGPAINYSSQAINENSKGGAHFFLDGGRHMDASNQEGTLAIIEAESNFQKVCHDLQVDGTSNYLDDMVLAVDPHTRNSDFSKALHSYVFRKKNIFLKWKKDALLQLDSSPITHNWCWFRKPLRRRSTKNVVHNNLNEWLGHSCGVGLVSPVEGQDSPACVDLVVDLREKAVSNSSRMVLSEGTQNNLQNFGGLNRGFLDVEVEDANDPSLNKEVSELELREEAEATWQIGKMLGMSFLQEKEEVVRALMEEERKASEDFYRL